MNDIHRGRLFLASCVALVVTAMSFAIRGDIMGDLEGAFTLSKTQLGMIAGTAFWGFTLAMVIGGPLCDVLGMRRLVVIAFVGHLAGILVTIFAGGFWTLYAGTLAIGIANGFVEAACNPLIATVYPAEKTRKLNQFHVWFPGGIVIGALGAFALSKLGTNGAGIAGVGALWQWKMGLMLVPLAAYGTLFLGQRFPVTERVASGVSTGAMFKECLRPLFILMIACMFLTASTELGPGQWIPNILTFTAGVSGILVLAWINGLMAVGRQFAGPVVHRLSPPGVLLASAVLAAIGLFLLSRANSGMTAFAAATVFALGVCYFWPTMLGFVAERLPKTGALGLSLMGGAGMLAVAFVLPIMGRIYDRNTDTAIPEGFTREALLAAAPESAEGAMWAEAQAVGGAATLGAVAVVPLVLVVAFGAIYFHYRGKGGYKPEVLSGGDPSGPSAPND